MFTQRIGQRLGILEFEMIDSHTGQDDDAQVFKEQVTKLSQVQHEKNHQIMVQKSKIGEMQKSQ